LYWEILRLRAAELLDEQTFVHVQRQLDTAHAYYATHPDYDVQVRRILVAALRRTSRTEPDGENAHLHDGQQGRAYARRVHVAGVLEAEKHARRAIFIAGMLGVPTSKGELALIVALPAGGYLVGKVVALTYKKAALLLRKLRTPEEVLTRASALGIRVERVESKAELESLLGKDAVASVDSAPRDSEGLISAAKGGETIFRVQGGVAPNASKVRFQLGADGRVTIAGEDMLFVNLGQEGRALEFLAKRGDTAELVRFQVTPEFAARLRAEAVPQRLGRQFPGRPQAVDAARAPDQFGIPPSMFGDLIKNIVPGTSGSGRP
jgi:hypothetical protein